MAATGPTLSDVSLYGRQAIKFGAIGLVVFMLGRIILTQAVTIYLALNPPPPPPPTVGFGLLPQPAFPTQSVEDRPQGLTLETVGQQLPYFGDQAPVFFMPTAQPSLVALEQAKAQASALGFTLSPEKVSGTLYRWRRDTPIPSTLEIDIVSGSINMEVNWPSSPGLLEKKMIPTPQGLTTELRTILRNIDLNEPDIATAEPKITYWKALGGQLREAVSVSDADFVRVDLFRVTPIADRPSITHLPGEGVVQILFSGSRDQGERILSLKSRYQSVDIATTETYPIQNTAQAWQTLQSGGGFVINKGTAPNATVRSAYLAYYEPATAQNYYQPVYVFEGDGGFQALVPAIAPAWFTGSQSGQ